MLLLPTFTIFSSLFFGFEAISLLLQNSFNIITRAAIGSVFGNIFSAWIFYILQLWIPLSQKHGTYHSLVLLHIAIIIHIYRSTKKIKRIPILHATTYVFGVLFPAGIMLYLTYDGLLYDGFWTHAASYGDFPFHCNIISSFAYGCNKNRKHLFDIVSPFYAHVKLGYPFIPNYYAAVLMSCYGISIHDGAFLPSVPFIFAVFIILTDLIYHFTNSNFAAIVGSLLFTFNGGTGFTSLFIKEKRDHWVTDYVHFWGENHQEFWLQSIAHILLPQRASLFSIPIAWSVILILIKFNGTKDIKGFIAAGLLVAELPQVHPHSIIGLAQYGFSLFLLTFPYKNTQKSKIFLRNYFTLGIIAIVFGAFQCIPYLGRTTTSNFMRFGWVNYGDYARENLLQLWWRALGAFIVMALFHTPIILDSKQMCLYLPSIFVFIIGNFVRYQPWAVDNTKVWNAAFIPIATAGVALFLVKLFKHNAIGKLTSLVLFFFSCWAGYLCVVRTIQSRSNEWDIYDAPYSIADFIIRNTEPDAVWMTDYQHENPIVTLAGRQVLVGYIGWLQNHGLDYNDRQRIMRNLVNDPENTTEVDLLDLKYVGFRPAEPEYRFNPGPNSTHWENIYNSVVFSVWKRKHVF